MTRLRLPASVIAIGAIAVLTAGTGTAVASHLITGKDIKNHSITTKDLSKSTVKALHGARGPKGGPATQWYGGHISVLNTLVASQGFASPVGYSQAEASSTNFVDAIGPHAATTATNLTVHLQNAPGAGSTRTFEIVVNATPSAPCTIEPTGTDCTVTLNQNVPADALIYIESDVTGADAQGADAAFAWSTSG
jgi:hypothetical protein